jgi:NADPH-dependent 2,4-dienoyl-CoA reductase/sulfur reductase-like enzyme
MNSTYDVVVIGAGPAGLAAAIEAKKTGASVLIIERNDEPGGILPQCIHNGFGSVIFKQDLPGPAYAANFVEQAKNLNIEMLLDTTVLDIKPVGTSRDLSLQNENLSGQHGSAVPAITVTATSREGFLEFQTNAVVLAMGCRERTRAQIRIPGDRPAGVFTAGMVQRLVNIEGYMPGKNFVILGSGDIGMIMARRLTIEGAKVLKVVELMPYLTGLRRNYVQCLQDFNIPLSLSTTIKRIIGKKRVEAVETVRVDETLNPIPETLEIIPCDSLLLSVGLIPENELSKKAGVQLDPLTGGPIVDAGMMTSVPGIFSAGNVVTIYDLVDYVSKAGMLAGRNAAGFAAGKSPVAQYIDIKPGEGVRSVVPQKLPVETPLVGVSKSETGTSPVSTEILLELRVSREFPEKISVDLMDGATILKSFKQKYARPAEMITLNLRWAEVAAKLGMGVKELTVRVSET